jgi:SAM-dependent methyltransferase
MTAWLEALEARHLADLTFREAVRSLRALSSAYVERRGRLREGSALAGRGKRAAFALFYGPIHFLLLRHIVDALPDATDVATPLVDLGCGTGASSAAWASVCPRVSDVVAIDRHPWAAAEARRTYAQFGVRARVRVEDIARVRLPTRATVLAAFTLNELSARGRAAVLAHLTRHARRGGRVLIVEPLAGSAVPWWDAWRESFEPLGGRAEEWRVPIELPPLVEKLDRAAGLDHRVLTGRSLWV